MEGRSLCVFDTKRLQSVSQLQWLDYRLQISSGVKSSPFSVVDFSRSQTFPWMVLRGLYMLLSQLNSLIVITSMLASVSCLQLVQNAVALIPYTSTYRHGHWSLLDVPKSRLKHQRDWALCCDGTGCSLRSDLLPDSLRFYSLSSLTVYESCHSLLLHWGFIVFWFTLFNVLPVFFMYLCNVLIYLLMFSTGGLFIMNVL